MSDRNEVPRTFSVSSIPAVDPKAPPPSAATQQLAQAINEAPQASADDAARQRIASLEREARALAYDPAAALLFHEIGLLWEDPLRNPRNAAVAYQNAFRLAPHFVGNIQAARRLFAEVGNWQMVVQLIDAELSATEDLSRKAPLLFEKALVLESRLSREEDAQQALRLCLDAKPKDLTLLVQLEGVYAEKNDFAALVEVYRLLAASLSDDGLRAHYLTLAGELLERLERPEEAAKVLREAFALDKRDPLLLASAVRIAERDGNTDELLAALAAEAEQLGPQAAPTYLRLAKVFEKLSRQEDALSALLAARRVSPNEPLVLSELAQIYEAQGRHEDLADVLLSWAGDVSDESELVALNLRLAALYEENLKRDDAAIARYRAILEHVPGEQAALAGLGKLYYRLQSWEELVKVFDAEIAALEDPRQQAARMFKAAEILEERMGQQEEAIGRYNRCLQLQPGYLPAQKALTRLYEKQARWADLAAMYEQDLLQTADRDEMFSTLNKMATLYEDRLSDLDRAIDCMKRILEVSSDHLPTLRNLSRLLERAGRWPELISLNETEASIVGDTKQVLSLYHRNAELLEEQVHDRAGAIAAYERLLALSPAYLPALKALGRLYARDGRWEDLVRMYRAEAEISPSPQQAAALIHKIGELYEQKLANENEAIASYQEVLTLSPSYFPALRALGRIYRAQGAWESLIEVLRAEAANRTDPAERANALYQAAAIWENQLGRQDMAIDGCQEVLRLTPGHAAAIRTLERFYTGRGEVKELIAVLDRETQTGQTPAARVAAYLKLAHLYLDRLKEPARAAKVAEAALGIDPTNLSALKVLERIRAGDRTRRAELRERIAERVQDPRLRSALKLSAAADREQPGVDPSVDELLAAFADSPGDARLGFQLERVLRKAGDAARLVQVYERRLEQLTHPLERTCALLRIAELSRTRLGDAARAESAYEAALELTPGILPALQGLRALALSRGDSARARALLESEGRAARDNEGAIDAWVQAGELAWREQDGDAAVACCRKALERNPLEPRASTLIEEILAARGGAADLAALHERRGEAMLAQKDLPHAAAEFFNAACAWAEQLGDKEKAHIAVERALAAQPTHVEALELKSKLALEAGQFAEAGAALAVRIQQGGEADHLSGLHLTLGALYQDHLGDVSRAAAHLQTALAANPRSPEALDRLAAIHTASRNWTGAADCLKRLLELGGAPADLARHTLRLAQILDEGMGDAQGASALFRQALELAPGDDAVISRLVELYQRMGNLPELATLLEQQAQSAGDVKRAVNLRLQVADLFAGPLEEPQKAIAYYRYVVDLDTGNTEAHEALAKLFMRDAAAAPMAIEEHRTLLRLEPARMESLHSLFRLWESLKQTDKAFCAAGLLHFFHAQNEVEASFYGEARSRLPQDASASLLPSEVDQVLHPRLRNSPVLEVLRAVGDQLSKLYPPNFESAGIDRRADRLKPDHAVHKAIRAVAQVFGVEEFDVYQSRRGQMFLETSEPLSVCVGQDVVRKFNAREQKFLIGRAVLGLLNKTAVLQKLSQGELADLIGNAVRIFHPDYAALGHRSEEASKQLRKACSRRALKALESPALVLSGGKEPDLAGQLEGLTLSSDRAGLLVCGDVAAGLNMLLRDDPNYSALKPESTDPIAEAVKLRSDLKDLLSFALSDEFFRLRQKTGMSL